MRRCFFAVMIAISLGSPLSALAGGTTTVVFDFPSTLDEYVPLSCLVDVNTCGGTFAVTNQSDLPFLNKISITHDDKPSWILGSCEKVPDNPAGYIYVYGNPLTPKDRERKLYFALNQPLCSFNPKDVRWLNNSNYQASNLDWTPTRPAIIDPTDIQEMCRLHKGETVPITKAFSANLKYKDKEESVGMTQLKIDFHCPSLPPYLGCYMDDHSRKLPVLLSSTSTMTIEQCVMAARARNLNYAGAQFGGQCFGGNALMISDLANQADCNMRCNADGNEICGGTWRNSVYRTADVTRPSKSPGVLIGCYVDDPSRKLPVRLSSSANMTIEQCIAGAAAQKLPFAGLQFGGQCFGGNTLTNTTRADLKECNMPCNANNREKCGGIWRNSVYLSGYPPSPCARGLTGCGSDCKNLSNDGGNCGACGHYCLSRQMCMSGQCIEVGPQPGAISCPNGQIACQGACRVGSSCP